MQGEERIQDDFLDRREPAPANHQIRQALFQIRERGLIVREKKRQERRHSHVPCIQKVGRVQKTVYDLEGEQIFEPIGGVQGQVGQDPGNDKFEFTRPIGAPIEGDLQFLADRVRLAEEFSGGRSREDDLIRPAEQRSGIPPNEG